MISLLPYQISFKSSSLPLKPYEKPEFIQSQKIPTEADVIENSISMDSDITDASNIYTTIGKIFENEGLFSQAKMCFEKNAQLLLNKQASIKEINENEDDLQRIHSKIRKSLDIVG